MYKSLSHKPDIEKKNLLWIDILSKMTFVYFTHPKAINMLKVSVFYIMILA